MNIFVLDKCPRQAARYLCDKHIVKMVLESAQMLCTVHNGVAPYKVAHKNHPCTIWTRTSMSNYNWLIEHGEEIGFEYTKRFGKHHKSSDVIEWCKVNRPPILDIGLTEFAQAMPDKYKNTDAVLAYRTYYVNDKKDIAYWKRTETPLWYTEMSNGILA
jgi:hypothetical protein